MRTLAAIFAVLMSVTTGGPLRCPCQLAKLCLPGERPCQDAPAVPAAPTQKCGCKAHTTDEQRAPADQHPEERSPKDHSPCQHGPAADLVAPTAGERLAGDLYGDALFLSAPGLTPVACPATANAIHASRLDVDSSPQALLRYTHSFRC